MDKKKESIEKLEDNVEVTIEQKRERFHAICEINAELHRRWATKMLYINSGINTVTLIAIAYKVFFL